MLLLDDFLKVGKLRRDGYGNLPVYIETDHFYEEKKPVSYIDVGKINRYDLEKKSFVAETVILIG